MPYKRALSYMALCCALFMAPKSALSQCHWLGLTRAQGSPRVDTIAHSPNGAFQTFTSGPNLFVSTDQGRTWRHRWTLNDRKEDPNAVAALPQPSPDFIIDPVGAQNAWLSAQIAPETTLEPTTTTLQATDLHLSDTHIALLTPNTAWNIPLKGPATPLALQNNAHRVLKHGQTTLVGTNVGLRKGVRALHTRNIDPRSIAATPVWGLHSTPNALWLWNQQGIYTANDGSGRWTRVLPSPTTAVDARSTLFVANNTVWILSHGQLYRALPLNGPSWERMEPPSQARGPLKHLAFHQNTPVISDGHRLWRFSDGLWTPQGQLPRETRVLSGGFGLGVAAGTARGLKICVKPRALQARRAALQALQAQWASQPPLNELIQRAITVAKLHPLTDAQRRLSWSALAPTLHAQFGGTHRRSHTPYRQTHARRGRWQVVALWDVTQWVARPYERRRLQTVTAAQSAQTRRLTAQITGLHLQVRQHQLDAAAWGHFEPLDQRLERQLTIDALSAQLSALTTGAYPP